MKRSISYILAGIAAVSLTACEGFLEKAPILSQSTELTLSSYDGLNKATLGAYAYFASTGWYGGERVLESEMRSGNGMKSPDRNKHDSNRYITNYNWNYTADATSALWAYGYYMISRANNVIDNLEGKESADVSEQDLNNLKAECLFCRAYAHFDMVTLYGQPYTYQKDSPGVPYVFHTESDARPARNTVAEVYDFIVADLLEAEQIIDPEYVRGGVADPKACVTIYAIQALLSRVYLYMGQWQKAADYATKVIDSGEFKMWTPSNYVKAWKAETGGDEVIFEAYIGQSNRGNEQCSYMTNPDGAYGDCLTSNELYDLYAEGDVRKTCFRQDTDESEGMWWTLKYAGKGLGAPDANNTVLLRLSEMYLNRAEALVNGATISKATAVSDLNTITKNRGAESYSAVGMDAIRTERRKELAWEGHHFFDMARWGRAVNRAANIQLTSANQNIPFPDYRWALPIPKRELEVNPNLEQNDKY